MKKAASILVLALLTASLLAGCSDSNSSAVSSGSTATATALSIAGGEGTVYSGGGGGMFNVYPYDNTSVKISRSGSVDTTVDTAFFDNLIASANLDFGAVPMIVTTSTTIYTYPAGTVGLTDGQFYMHVDSPGIFKYDAAGDQELPVTGIHIMPGVTLALGLNYNLNNSLIYANWNGICPTGCDSGYDVASFVVTNDIWNQGTITTMDLVTGKDDILNAGANTADGTMLDKGSLIIQTNTVFLNDGMITTKGTDTTLAIGGWGGNISVWADRALVNRFTIDSSGGKGMDGGRAGDLSLRAGHGLWNTGPVNAKGGTGTDGEGGYGSRIHFETGLKIDTFTYVWQSLLYNSGTLNSSGGDGTSGGGHAAGATLYAGESWGYACGAFVNSGNLIGNGGNATTSGFGGDGANWWYADAPHDLGAYGCNLLNSGAIEFKGGTGKGVDSYGGSGGQLYVWTAMNYDYSGNVVAPGSILFGGSVLADGGAGETGGGGGYVEIENYAYLQAYDGYGNYVYATNSGSIEVLGYGTVNIKGGKGAIYGGYGGSSVLYWNVSDTNNVVSPSSIYNDTDFDMTGGQGVAGNGGSGGYFFAEMGMNYVGNPGSTKPGAKSTLPAPGSIDNRGNITTKGGQGALYGGDAGSFYDNGYYDYDLSIWMIASGNITNTGALNASGGLATDAAGIGGYSYPVVLDAVGNVLNSGSINVNGGDGKAAGGGADWVYFYSDAGTNINTAAITANGGNANAVDGSGGYGGLIEIYTSSGPMIATNTGTLSVTGGTGFNLGSDGNIYVGWY